MKLETIDDVLKLNTLCGIQDKAKANPQGKTMKLLVSRLTQTGIKDKVEEIVEEAGEDNTYLWFEALTDSKITIKLLSLMYNIYLQNFKIILIFERNV